jgi:hypothetical protein
VAYIRYRPRTVAIDVLLSFNFAVVFNFNVFPFPPSKPQFLCDVPMSRREREREMEMGMEMLMARGYGDGKGDGDGEGDVEIGRQRLLREWRDKSKNERRSLRQYIDATMHLAPVGNSVRICCVIDF